MLLQVPEQREAAENEIRIHHLLDHDNIIQLINSEIKDKRNGEGTALLIFPYYNASPYNISRAAKYQPCYTPL